MKPHKPDPHPNGPLSRLAVGALLSSPRMDTFADELERVGNCANPIRIRGFSTRIDTEVRKTTVARKTHRFDMELRRLVPTSIQNLNVSAVSEREVARSFETLLASGLAESSVVRYRASLSVSFGWCVREKLIASNPVAGVGAKAVG